MNSNIAIILGNLNRGNRMKVFDWNKAAIIIREEHIKNADAGLFEDFEWTGGQILEEGHPLVGEYTYLASTWATPVLIDEDGYVYRCWTWEDQCEWDAKTQWPTSAVLLLGEKNETN